MGISKQLSALKAAINELLPDLHSTSACESYGLSRDAFSVILLEVGEKYVSESATGAEIRTFFLSLRVEELALARACAEGYNPAWEVF